MASTYASMIDPVIVAEAAESVRYEQPGVPLYIEEEGESTQVRHDALMHWHDGVELIHVLAGGMRCFINDVELDLQPGDFCFINSGQMHVADSGTHGDYRANIVILDPALMTRNDTVFAQYIKPIVDNKDFSHFHLLASTGSAAELCRLVDEISELERNKPPAYELTVIGLLHLAFTRIYLAYTDENAELHPTDHDASTQRRMSQYIYDHFAEKITLDDIAAAGNVSRSKCSKVFKHYLQKSPIDFLNLYRLEVASRLLKNTTESVSRISAACGFSQQSYFDRQFGRAYGCTPREYREQFANAS